MTACTLQVGLSDHATRGRASSETRSASSTTQNTPTSLIEPNFENRVIFFMTLPKHAAGAPHNRPPLSLVSSRRITALQIGIGWFPETPGGLDCVYYNLARHLPERGVDVIGLVAGSENVIRDSQGQRRQFRPARGRLEIKAARRPALCHGGAERRQGRPDRQPFRPLQPAAAGPSAQTPFRVPLPWSLGIRM